MADRFQIELGKALDNLAVQSDFFVWHPPDGIGPWRPGDWIFGWNMTWGVIEAKQTPSSIFSSSMWTPQQVQYMRRVVRAGGKYWLVINFLRSKATPNNKGVVFVWEGNTAHKYLEVFGAIDVRNIKRRYEPILELQWDEHSWEPLAEWLR